MRIPLKSIQFEREVRCKMHVTTRENRHVQFFINIIPLEGIAIEKNLWVSDGLFDEVE